MRPKKYLQRIFVLLTFLLLFFGHNLLAQTNSFPATGHASIGGANYLRVGSRTFFQSPSHTNNLATRGIMSTSISWDAETSQWQVAGGAYSDFSLLRFENSGVIGLFNRATTGSSYSMTNAELESFRRVTILSNGNMGVGTRTPHVRLQVAGVISVRDTASANGFMTLNPGSATAQGFISWYKPGNSRVAYMGATDGSGTNNLALNLASGANFILNGGSMAIGTSDPKGYKLAVAGSMVAESVRVKLRYAWPDYVFDERYNLMPIEELEQFVKTNDRLPGMPAAKQIEKEGLDLEEVNRKLLEKIEELTLYIIQLNNRNEQQDAELKQQKERLEKLEKL